VRSEYEFVVIWLLTCCEATRRITYCVHLSGSSSRVLEGLFTFVVTRPNSTILKNKTVQSTSVDLSPCLNKSESVGLRKCPYYHSLILRKRCHNDTITNISQSLPDITVGKNYTSTACQHTKNYVTVTLCIAFYSKVSCCAYVYVYESCCYWWMPCHTVNTCTASLPCGLSCACADYRAV